MWWLWIVGPLAVLAIYLLTAQTDHDRTLLEIELWRNALAARKKKGQKAPPPADKGASSKKGTAGKQDKKAPAGKQDKPAPAKQKPAIDPLAPPEARSIATEFMRMLERAGGGTVVGHYELVTKLAYLSVLSAMSTASSDQQTVVAKLGKAGPAFSVRPLPIVDGQRVANTGVKFSKDPEFMAEFLVEGADPKAIGKWLIRPLREALRELPDAWLFVEGKGMALTLYGRPEASRMEALVATADELFAEHGAKGGPSLFGVEDEDDDEEEAAAAGADQEEEDDGSSEDGEEEEEDEDEAAGDAGEDRAASK